MKTEEIAQRLVALSREQKWETAQKELYAADVVSIEPAATPGFDKETGGSQKSSRRDTSSRRWWKRCIP